MCFLLKCPRLSWLELGALSWFKLDAGVQAMSSFELELDLELILSWLKRD
jgi:hypothetical protein